MTLSLIYDLMILLAAGLFAAVLCRRLKVSILIGYLLVGTVIGHGVLGWVQDEEHQLAHFAELGVFLLLFSIGLEFSLEDLKRLGKNFVIGGSLQMGLVAAPVAACLLAMGMAWQPALLIASAVSFSSTVLVFRALSEYGQFDKPHGRRAIGILLFQDAALVPLLLMVPLLTGSEAAGIGDYLKLAAVSLAFIAAIVGLRYGLSQWGIPLLTNFRSSELIVLFTVVSIGGVTLAAYQVGLPPAVGAFAAGLIFNGNRWSHQIDALVLPFRETFAAIFFVGLGLIFDPRLLWREPELVLFFLPAVIVIKCLAATIALRLTQLPMRTALGMGIGLAHIGEFAFVLALLAADSGLLSEEDYQRVVGIAVGSLLLTPTLIKFGLRLFQSNQGGEESSKRTPFHHSEGQKVAVIGAGPIGRSISSQFETYGYDVCVVDLSPINLHSFAQQGFRTVAGNATSETVLESAEIAESELVVVCVPNDTTAIRVVKLAHGINPHCRVIVRCRYQSNLGKLFKAGATDAVAEENEAALALTRLLRLGEPTSADE